ncbi:hypothetical protein EB796_012100 [Bugula neritina]|uniref:TANGO6 HEAT repeat domain-containing protein n=1 Tax=Bugula neritina TaxID=10212 RepID=A0A7J7JW61_BUGNE|nr:hypothetical protein EB796_012100 [Bugula neritina]
MSLGGWTAQRYYKLIALQVLSLLTNTDQSISRQYSRVCAATMSCVSTAHPDLMHQLFWQPLTCDILSTSSDKQEVCLKTLCKIIFFAAEPRSHLLPLCMQILPDIFSVYLQNKSSVVVTDTRLYCEELLSTCLQFSSNQSVSNFLYDIATTSATLSADVLTAEDTHSAAILFCVSKVSESSVVQKFFIQLLEKLSSLMSHLNPNMVGSSTSIENNSPELSGLLIKYRLMSLLSTLCETESKACLQHPQYIIKFIKV